MAEQSVSTVTYLPPRRGHVACIAVPNSNEDVVQDDCVVDVNGRGGALLSTVRHSNPTPSATAFVH